MNNQGPIALLYIISKAFERIIAKQLFDYLKNSSLLSMSQFGCHADRGTESALFRLSKLLSTAKQNGLNSVVTPLTSAKLLKLKIILCF